MFENPYLVHIFAQNVATWHPKLDGIPIGLSNNMWPHGNLKEYVENRSNTKITEAVYVGYLSNTHPERQFLKDALAARGVAVDSFPLPFNSYIKRMSSFQYVATPRGNGLDTHRLWEVFYSGSIPVTTHNSLHYAFPTVSAIVRRSWEEAIESACNGGIEALSGFSSRIFTLSAFRRLLKSKVNEAIDLK